ncbi:hypothetical protein ABZ815_02170 [Nonomuraea sp. NPDC047529]|uniref:hypothetical protein n=1 Tax=Nonomuraea sp. NPDC047529 TaxID=3155623 RepID=UPI0034020ABD
MDSFPSGVAGDAAVEGQAVAAYIAKYATKAAECVGTLDRRIQPLDISTPYLFATTPAG